MIIKKLPGSVINMGKIEPVSECERMKEELAFRL